MRCLCCNKELESPTDTEMKTSWHNRCIKKFFGTSDLPEIELKKEILEKIVNSTVSKGLTVPGVQKKLSLHLSKEKGIGRLTVVDYPTGYILKPQSMDYRCLPEAEFLAMKLAELSGIKTVPNALVRINGEYAYITGRIDRISKKMFAMEDFCQLSERPTADKYKGSYEGCGRIIKKYSQNIGIDMTEFFYRLLFCFVIGNSDMHLKNFSLIENAPGSRVFDLSAAYDLLPVNIVVPADKEEVALTLNGKKQNIRKKDFLCLAENLEISKKTAEAFIKRITGFEERYVECVADSYLPEDMRNAVAKLIRERINRLENKFW